MDISFPAVCRRNERPLFQGRHRYLDHWNPPYPTPAGTNRPANLTCGNCNRWQTNVFTNLQDPTSKNLETFFYRFEFQKRSTLHLHILVWVKDISATRADLLYASVPWGNARDAFTVASIQKSDKSCLPVCQYPDSFITERNGRHPLQFQHTEDDAERHIWAYVTTLLGSLHCKGLSSQICEQLRHKNAWKRDVWGSILHRCHWLPGHPFLPSYCKTPRTGDGLSAVQHQGLLDGQVHSVVQATISGSDRRKQGVQNVSAATANWRGPDSFTMVNVPPNIWLKAQRIHRRPRPGGHQVRLPLQSHILLPTFDHEFPALQRQPVETCWGRHHAWYHQTFCTMHCLDPPILGHSGDHNSWIWTRGT